MKNIFVLCFVFTLTSSFTQEIEKEKKWIIKANLLSLVDFFSFPTAQIGIERKITKDFSINVETGLQIYNLGLGKKELDTLVLKNKGFKINIEGRYYITNLLTKSDLKSKKPYFGIQLFYRQYNYGNSVFYTIDPNYDKPYSYNQENNIKIETISDEYEVQKTIYGLNITAGMQLKLYKNFIFEPYVGAGIMNWNAENFNRSFKNNKIESTTCNHCFFTDFSEDSGLKFNLTYGFRIGYKL